MSIVKIVKEFLTDIKNLFSN